ncbi:MAG TPA: tetratricopeptide repeat protein, partial [Ignavibacteriaceae bacterium]|nr:tetratricopeptide repeat protein [Ignavibacteriaceae bacterium]
MGIDTKYKLELRLKTAQDYEANGETLHALQIYNSIIDDEPGYVDAYFCLVELYEKQNKIESAKNLLRDFLIDNPENNLVRLFYAQFLLRNSQWENVIENLQPINISEEPIAAFFLGYSFFMLKNYQHAKINFLHFVSSGKKTELLHETYIFLAKTEIQLRNFESALEFAKKSEIVYSNFWELNLVFAIIHYNLGMQTHAITSITKSLKLNPNETSIYKWAGKIFLKVGEYIKAEENFLKYIGMVEYPSSEIYFELGEAYLKTNKVKDALQYYELALKIDP